MDRARVRVARASHRVPDVEVGVEVDQLELAPGLHSAHEREGDRVVAADAHEHRLSCCDLPRDLCRRVHERLEIPGGDDDVPDVRHRHAREVLLPVVHALESDAGPARVGRAVEWVSAVEESRVRTNRIGPLGLAHPAVRDQRALVVRHAQQRDLVIEGCEVAEGSPKKLCGGIATSGDAGSTSSRSACTSITLLLPQPEAAIAASRLGVSESSFLVYSA